MTFIISVIAWALFSFIVATGARNRNRSGPGFFLLSCLFSPLLGGLALLVLGTKAKNDSHHKRAPSRICDFCKAEVRADALKCMYCQSDIASTAWSTRRLTEWSSYNKPAEGAMAALGQVAPWIILIAFACAVLIKCAS